MAWCVKRQNIAGLCQQTYYFWSAVWRSDSMKWNFGRFIFTFEIYPLLYKSLSQSFFLVETCAFLRRLANLFSKLNMPKKSIGKQIIKAKTENELCLLSCHTVHSANDWKSNSKEMHLRQDNQIHLCTGFKMWPHIRPTRISGPFCYTLQETVRKSLKLMFDPTSDIGDADEDDF